MNNLHERDLNLPLEWARERNHSSLKSVTRFGLVYLRERILSVTMPRDGKCSGKSSLKSQRL